MLNIMIWCKTCAVYEGISGRCMSIKLVRTAAHIQFARIVLFDLGLTSLSTIFQSYRDGVWM